MYSPLLYNERHTSPIQYTKNIYGMASLVDAIRKLLKKYNTLTRAIQNTVCYMFM